MACLGSCRGGSAGCAATAGAPGASLGTPGVSSRGPEVPTSSITPSRSSEDADTPTAGLPRWLAILLMWSGLSFSPRLLSSPRSWPGEYASRASGTSPPPGDSRLPGVSRTNPTGLGVSNAPWRSLWSDPVTRGLSARPAEPRAAAWLAPDAGLPPAARPSSCTSAPCWGAAHADGGSGDGSGWPGPGAGA